jgi:hypothetical protein
VGEEPNHTTARKPGPLYIIQYSLVCDIDLTYNTLSPALNNGALFFSFFKAACDTSGNAPLHMKQVCVRYPSWIINFQIKALIDRKDLTNGGKTEAG